jgi:hypothetical protein
VPVEGTTIRLGQVATVIEDHRPLIGDAMNGNGQGLMLMVEKLPGVNTLEVSDHVLEALEALKPGMAGVDFDPNVYYPAGYIETSARNVGNALLIALILAAVMLLALSYDWRAALIGLIAIPASLVAAALAVNFTGGSMNVMVLAGLMIGLGVIVDDAIVYTSNLFRRVRRDRARPSPTPSARRSPACAARSSSRPYRAPGGDAGPVRGRQPGRSSTPWSFRTAPLCSPPGGRDHAHAALTMLLFQNIDPCVTRRGSRAGSRASRTDGSPPVPRSSRWP